MYGWLLSWVWLSDKVHVKGGYAVSRFTFLICIITLGICFFSSIFLFFFSLFPFLFIFIISHFYLMDVVGGHVSFVVTG